MQKYNCKHWVRKHILTRAKLNCLRSLLDRRMFVDFKIRNQMPFRGSILFSWTSQKQSWRILNWLVSRSGRIKINFLNPTSCARLLTAIALSYQWTRFIKYSPESVPHLDSSLAALRSMPRVHPPRHPVPMLGAPPAQHLDLALDRVLLVVLPFFVFLRPPLLQAKTGEHRVKKRYWPVSSSRQRPCTRPGLTVLGPRERAHLLFLRPRLLHLLRPLRPRRVMRAPHHRPHDNDLRRRRRSHALGRRIGTARPRAPMPT